MGNHSNISPHDYKSKTILGKILSFFGYGLSLIMVIFVAVALGFMSESPLEPRLRGEALMASFWINCVLGVVAALLVEIRKPLTSIISGLLLGPSVTGVAYLYMFWRDSIQFFELAVILVLAWLPSALLFFLLKKKLKY